MNVRSGEKDDEMGVRPCIHGLVEDRGMKVPLLSYKPFIQLEKNGVFRFENAYVHGFQDGSLMLVLTEYSRIRWLPDENPAAYYWQPNIGQIKRPLSQCMVTLEGVVTRIYDSSGLVKRCDRCGSIIQSDMCYEGHRESYHWALRASGRLNDQTGSISFILNQYLTCRLLDRPISEVHLLSSIHYCPEEGKFDVETFQFEPIDNLAVVEAKVLDDPLSHRVSDRIIIPDKNNLKVYFPPNVDVDPENIIERKEILLRFSEESDRKLILKLIEKALDSRLRELVGYPRIHGIYLLEKPLPLYGCEQAKLYLGFEAEVRSSREASAKLEIHPEALIRESVHDYVSWRRGRGASAASIRKALLMHRSTVILAPYGNLGKITDLQFVRAKDYRIPITEQALPEFWQITYGVEVDPEEMPLLTVEPYDLQVPLTYPSSCVFFDQTHILMPANVLRFIAYKKRDLATRALNIATQTLQGLAVGDRKLRLSSIGGTRTDAQRMILRELKEKLLGKRLKASGPVIRAGERLYFTPKTVDGACS